MTLATPLPHPEGSLLLYTHSPRNHFSSAFDLFRMPAMSTQSCQASGNSPRRDTVFQVESPDRGLSAYILENSTFLPSNRATIPQTDSSTEFYILENSVTQY